MDGLLVVDKPDGPTSHDVVARVRRLLGERRIGHTGTLDPAATGVLPLVLGRATRLARFLSGRDKSYEAVVRLGISTDTYDSRGEAVGARHAGAWPTRGEIDAALGRFRGTFDQQPPAFSAKKIDGVRSYALARHGRGRFPAPVSVSARAIDIASVDGDCVTIRIDCSAGFYVRSLANDLGAALGIGAHLGELRRTRSGDFTLAESLPLDDVEDRDAARAAIIPLASMLPGLSAVVLTEEGAWRAARGRDVRPVDAVTGGFEAAGACRLVDQTGQLLGIAEPTGSSGLLHPSVVLV